MPLTLKDLAAARATVDVDLSAFGVAETLPVTYRTLALTPARELRFARLMDEGLDREARTDELLTLFAEIVQSWALGDGEGGTVPVEPAALRAIPSQVLAAVLAEVLADPNRRTAAVGGSPATSSS